MAAFPQPFTNFGQAKHHQLTWEAQGVLRVSLNRGAVNAWIEEMWREFDAIFRHIKFDADVSAVVLSGEGRCFTAGLDLASDSLGTVQEKGTDAARKAMYMGTWLREFQDAISQLELCGKPVIAAIHNVAFGLAIDLLAAVDIRLAEDNARFCIREIDAGLAADIGTLQRFPKSIGNQSLVRELCLTGREFDAQEALSMGFLSKVIKGGRSAVLSEAIAIASAIAAKSPVAVRSTKALLLHSRDHSVQEGLEYTAAWNAAMLQSDDIPIAMAAIMQKQKPKFSRL